MEWDLSSALSPSRPELILAEWLSTELLSLELLSPESDWLRATGTLTGLPLLILII